MKRYKKLIAWLLVLMISITGCAGNTDSQKKAGDAKSENTAYNYDFSIYEDGRTFSEEQLAEQQEFEAYLKDIFVDEMSENTVTTHFLMEHPENYGVEKADATWGEVPDYLNTKEATDEIQGMLDGLEDISYDSLTYEQQLIYDMFQSYLKAELNGNKYPLFNSAFAPISGFQAELPIIFSEYSFLAKEDIDDYIELLNQSNDYIKKLCEYELYRMEKGYTLTKSSLEQVIAQCEEFVASEPNCLRPVFEEKLNQFSSLTEEEKNAYLEAFDKGLEESLIPGYELIISTLNQIKEKNVSKKGLCNYEGGKEYYEYLIRQNTGSGREIGKLYQMVKQELNRCSLGMSKIYSSNPNLPEEMDNYKYDTEDPDEILKKLASALKEDFPVAVNEEYSLNYVPESLESTMSPAFYLIPPIDNPKKNVIYINQAEEYTSMGIFPTIAHEGLPGHMYQSNYFYSMNPHYFRSLLSFNGYCEGWAHYIETCYSYKYSGMDSSLAKAFEYNSSMNFALYCMVDMGVNYYGWDYEHTKNFLAQYVGDNEEAISEVYNMMLDEPTVYLRYYGGYLEILALKDKASETLGDGFDIKEFHQFLLEVGPCQFDIIEDRMEEWMKRVRE